MVANRSACSRGRRPSQQVLLDLVSAAIAARGEGQHVVDLGGGTGGLAADLAGRGHTVTVVDPSPDALAAVGRRAAEAGVAERLTGVQGDTASLVDDLAGQSVDALLCHGILELIDDRLDALRRIAAVLRPGGLVSLTITQRYARALQRALGGHLTAAREAWRGEGQLDADEVERLLAEAGFTVTARAGIGLVGAWVPDEVSGARSQETVDFERELAEDPSLLPAAPLLHVLARRD